MFPKARDDRMSNPMSQKVRGGCSPINKPTCTKCGKKHIGDCLGGTHNCFGCGKSDHKVRNSPNVRVQEKGVFNL